VKPTAPLLERWTRGVIRWRVVIVGLWLAVIVTGVVAAHRLPPLLSTSLAVPGTASQQASTILDQHFGQNPDGTFTVVFRVARPPATMMHLLERRMASGAEAVPTGRATPLRAVAGIVFGNIDTAVDLQRAASYTPAVHLALTGAGTPPSYVTGPPALQYDINPVLAADLVRGEVIALSVALVLLVIVLGISPAVFIPFAFAACTTTAALAIVFGLAHVVLMMLYVPNLVLLIGLGLAMDYSLLVVHRFREELAGPERPVDDAIVSTMATAGRTVLLSAAAVALGLGVVLLIPVPFVRSLGIAGVLVPAVSIAAVLTVQPVLLSLLGRRGGRWSALSGPAAGSYGASGLWSGLARRVMDHPLPVLAGAAAVLVAAALPVTGLQLTPGAVSAVPQSTSSARGLTLLRERVGTGVVTPIEVVIDAGGPGKALSPAGSEATLRLARALLTAPDVFVVAIGSHPPYTASSGRYRTITVVAQQDFGAEATQQLVHRLSSQYLPAAHFPPGTRTYVGGAPAEGADFLARVYDGFPWLVLVVLAVAYLALLRAFRSLWLPFIAVVLDAASATATYGLVVVVFRYWIGHDILGLYRVPQVEGWVPAFLFAMLFGLSMDYEVFSSAACAKRGTGERTTAALWSTAWPTPVE
jgi:uncharacterized membrane protein YdfJ with MMPL/SSD domain